MADGYTFHIDGPLSLFTRDEQVRPPDGAVPAGRCCTAHDFRLDAELRWGPEARAADLPPRVERRPDLAPARHRHVRPGRAVRVRRAVPPGRPGLGGERGDRGRRAGPRGGLGPRLRFVHKATGTDVFVEVVGFWKRSSLERLLRLLPRHGPPRYVLAISEKLKVDEEALGELPGPILRFKEIPNAPELAALLDQFVGRPPVGPAARSPTGDASPPRVQLAPFAGLQARRAGSAPIATRTRRSVGNARRRPSSGGPGGCGPSVKMSSIQQVGTFLRNRIGTGRGRAGRARRRAARARRGGSARRSARRPRRERVERPAPGMRSTWTSRSSGCSNRGSVSRCASRPSSVRRSSPSLSRSSRPTG